MRIDQFKFEAFTTQEIKGRYITNEHLLKALPDAVKYQVAGNSVKGKPIYSLTLGEGPIRVLMWSQMHGNESTTTKAVVDLLHLLTSDSSVAVKLRKQLSLHIIPILNPDGAAAYTRENASGVDLNRDAQDQTQPESALLTQIFDSIAPDFCFNLHDQRTIYNVGNTDQPATLSFLSPAADQQRSVTPARKQAMQVIVAICEGLETKLSGRIGRYDDSFNPNCMGDYFQRAGTPTLLFEAGHSPLDYIREKTREYSYYALVHALMSIADKTYERFDIQSYKAIPPNNKQFLDIILESGHMVSDAIQAGERLGFLYEEQLKDEKVHFVPVLKERGGLREFFAHLHLDGSAMSIQELSQNYPALIEAISH